MAIVQENYEEKEVDVISFWKKYKNRIFGAIIFVVGLVGGNADRITEYLNDLVPDQVLISEDIENRLDLLEERVTILEKNSESSDIGKIPMN